MDNLSWICDINLRKRDKSDLFRGTEGGANDIPCIRLHIVGELHTLLLPRRPAPWRGLIIHYTSMAGINLHRHVKWMCEYFNFIWVHLPAIRLQMGEFWELFVPVVENAHTHHGSQYPGVTVILQVEA